MTEKVFTLKGRDDLAALYDLMDSRHVRHVPIVDSDGELVGLVTDRDLSRTALGAVEELPLSV
ncbi:MAG TPA: CBS domain-containing protein, partial [Thermoanaerobaculia bacterium]|nr:CBS domain-containing protein [Thermoanaerobaculia bacterium]